MSKVTIAPTEFRNVYLCKMTFLIPVRCIRREKAHTISIPLKFATSFVHQLNAEFHFTPINYGDTIRNAQPQKFWYVSKYDGHNKVLRQVDITPYLLKFNIGKSRENNYAIVLVAVINAHFSEANGIIRTIDWCTPHDLVNLERAMTENGENGLFTRPNQQGTSMYDWLDGLLKEVSNRGIRRIDISDIFSLSNISVQRLNTFNFSPLDVIKGFIHRYYNDNYYETIDNYLTSSLYNGYNKHQAVPGEYFIHGLLYKNDNFLQLHQFNVAEVQKNFYTNNRVEKYWADYGSIVTVKTGNPFGFIAPDEQLSPYYDDNLSDINCFMELCLLSKLSGLLKEFKKNSLTMKSHEIEQMKAKIAEYFSERLFYVRELDKRLAFFINRFGLDTNRDQINEIAQPRRNVLDLLFTRSNSIVVAILSVITIIIAFLTLLDSYGSH